MSIFGGFSNVFRKAVSTFAFKGKTFTETWDYTKKLPWVTSPIKAYRHYKESKTFHRLKPFYDKLPGELSFGTTMITPTQQRLKNRYQYIFDVELATSRIAGIQHQTFSFMADRRMTKEEVSEWMQQAIEDKEALEKYGRIQFMEVNLIGVRQSRWIK